jgi:hypothetical protein
MSTRYPSDTLRQVTIGRVTVTVSRQEDEDGYSIARDYLGEWSDYRTPATADQKLVHRHTLRVLDHHGIWRYANGRIARDPREDYPEHRYGRGEYQYTWHDNGHEKIAYAIADHKRLHALSEGEWSYYGVIATVTLNGVEIASSSVWGVESDSGDAYFLECGRDQAREALREARQWMTLNAPRYSKVSGGAA